MIPMNMPFQSSFDILKDEKIGYDQSVVVNSLFSTEVHHYSREFDTNIIYKLCTVQLNIPYTGIRGNNTIARILLYLDNDMIYDATIYTKESYILRPLNLSGHKCNLQPGHHTLKLFACTSKDELHIPHLSKLGPEFLIQPPISGSYLIIGYK